MQFSKALDISFNYLCACTGKICMDLTLQLKANPAEFTDLSGQYYLSNETIEGRPTWVNENDENQMWFYRINQEDIGGGQIQYTYNWVLSDNGDRVACAPGYVDSPLYLSLIHI